MASYQQIKARIAKLEREAAAARRKEKSDVIAKIHKMMADHELTVADLELKGARKTTRPAAKKTVGQPKFQDPASGKTWTGRGKPPGWIADALKSGEQDRFLIGGAAPGKSKATKVSKVTKVSKAKPAARKTSAGLAVVKKPAKAASGAATKTRAKAAATKAPAAKRAKAASKAASKPSAKAVAKKPAAKKAAAKVTAKAGSRAPRKAAAGMPPTTTSTPAEPAILLAADTASAD